MNVDCHAVLAGGISLAVVYLWRGKPNRFIPAPLLSLVVATAVLNLFFPGDTTARIGDIPSVLPALHLPVFHLELLQSMFINALMLAVLGSIDSLLTSLVAENVTDRPHDSDQELIGQGIGNAVAGLFGGLPGAGATMRTMVNIRAGGLGPLSGVVHSLLLIAIVGGLGFLFQDIPLAALAGILIKVGFDIIDWPFLRQLFRLPKFPVALMLTVMLLTVFVDLITAVFVGVFIKNLVTISRLSDLQLGSVVISDGIDELDRLPPEESRLLSQHPGAALLIRVTGPLSYAVGRGLNARVRRKVRGSRMLLLDLSGASIVGISTAMVLVDLVRNALSEGVVIKLMGADLPRHEELVRLGLLDLIATENRITRIEDAF